MVKLLHGLTLFALVALVGCGGNGGEGDAEQSPGDPLAALGTNTGTLECELYSANDLSVESCNKVVNIYLLMLRKRPYSLSMGLKSLDVGTYEVDGGGKGMSITLSDATDISDIKNYGIERLKVEIRESGSMISGTYEGAVNKDYTEVIPVRGMFKFSRSKVEE